MEPQRIDEARQALAQLQQRITRDVEDIKSVLRADLPKHVLRAVRHVFEVSPAADALTDAQLTALKRDTEESSAALTAAVLDDLGELETWLWPAGQPLPEDPEGFEQHPRLAEALARVPEGLTALLARHGLPGEALEEGGAYRVPSYFVAGNFLKSLLADYWRALTDHAELSQGLAESSQAETRQARRSRWEQA